MASQRAVARLNLPLARLFTFKPQKSSSAGDGLSLASLVLSGRPGLLLERPAILLAPLNWHGRIFLSFA